MALSSTMVWEVRSTGSDSFSGGFNAAGSSPGTDFSQADSAALTFVDLVIGAGNTVTSAAFPFGPIYNRNTLHISSGTGFTPGIYEITSVVGAVAHLDRSPGTLASTLGVATLGGALATPSALSAAIVPGNLWWARGGFTMNGSILFSPSGTAALPITGQGYTTVRGDGGFATWTATSGAGQLNLAGTNTYFFNFKGDGAGLYNPLRLNGAHAENCWGVNGTAWCIACDSFAPAPPTVLRRCKVSGSGTDGFALDGNCRLLACSATGNARYGFYVIDGGQLTTAHLTGCLAQGNAGAGFAYQDSANETQVHLLNCTADGNGDGLHLTTGLADATSTVENCLFANNTGYGFNSASVNYAAQSQLSPNFRNNGYYNNTLGNYHQIPVGLNDVLLTLDPFSNAAALDFSLNNATGAGAALRGAGDSPGIGLYAPNAEVTLSAPDIGASQSGMTTGGGGIGDPATLRSLWRELTNERSTVVIPDQTVDVYLNGGLQALNRRVKYHWTDTTSAVTLVAGQGEYAAPIDTVSVVWLRWNGIELQKSDMDEWRRRAVDWRAEKNGAPREWAHYRDKIIFYPAPDAAAVATDSGPLIRYVSSPPDFSLMGAEQLNLEDRRVIVYYGAAEFAAAHPDSALATIRSEQFDKRFDQEAQVIAAQYGDRLVGK